MGAFVKNTFQRLAAALYRGFLHAYPSEFRARYGVEMDQAFRDQLRDALSKDGGVAFLPFLAGIAWDFSTSLLREWFSLRSVSGVLCLLAAIGFSLCATYVDRHNATEVYPTLMVVLVGSLIAGLVRPRYAWRWAILIGLGVPFFGTPHSLPSRLTSPGNWAILAVLLIPGFLGAYAGSILRRAAAAW